MVREVVCVDGYVTGYVGKLVGNIVYLLHALFSLVWFCGFFRVQN